jgi:transposase
MADNKTTTVSESTVSKSRYCAYCGEQAPLVWVHGHGQCAHCGINVQECCQGETCDFR